MVNCKNCGEIVLHELPPMPNVKDFILNDIVSFEAYKAALIAWVGVCEEILDRR